MVRPTRGAWRGSRDQHTRQPLTQTDLMGVPLCRTDSESYGHNFPTNPSLNSSIITFQNIGPQPKTNYTSKARFNSRSPTKCNASVSLYTEHCLNEKVLDPQSTFSNRIKSSNSATFTYISNNTTEDSPWNLTGGTGFTIHHSLLSHKSSHGSDPTGLGRWTFVRLKGKHDSSISIFSAYRPCKNTTSLGSVWCQQQRYFQLQGDISPDPCRTFDKDLLTAIMSSLDSGDNVVLGVDNNDDVRTSYLSTKLKNLGLTDAILSQHAPSSPPATHNRNTSRTPIDAIWTTPGILVNRSGYLPFDHHNAMRSDHRLLWIEIDNSSALGKHLPSVVPIKACKINFTDPRSRRLYSKRVKAAIKASKVDSKIVSLQAQAKEYFSSPPSDQASLLPSLAASYNSIHHELDTIRSSVESNLRQIYSGRVPWSPRLKHYLDVIEYWRRYVKLRKGVNTSRNSLKRLHSRLKLPYGQFVDLQYATSMLQAAYSKYRTEAKPNAQAWREEHNEGLISALIKEGKPGNSTAVAIRARMKRERQARALGRGSKRITGKGSKQAILRAETLSPDGSIIELHTQGEMVAAMGLSNLNRQQQCLGTPSMSPPFTYDFGYLADTQAALDTIKGTYNPPPDTDSYLVEFLNTLAITASNLSPGSLHIDINTAENRSAWNSQSVTTSGEPSCLSFAHYKVASLDPLLNYIDTFFRSLPLAAGFSPVAWQRITDVEILKKEGVYLVDKMRLIQLMSPEFQINNKLVGKRILAHAEQAKAVSADQHGSRKGHTAINTALSKRLLCDLFRQKRRPAAVAMNDAKGCYDRISHPIAVLVLMSFGLPQKIACSLISTLQTAVHHIKTGYGRSGPIYGNELIPISGIGQGNGMGPTLWALISTILLLMMRRAGHGVRITSAITNTIIALVGFAFVDDTDLFCTNTPGEDLSTTFQAALDRWAGGLRATGGALSPAKSFCYLIDFQWSGNKWNYISVNDLPGEFTLTNSQGERSPLTRYEPSHAEKTLGVYISMDGNEEEEIKYLTQKCIQFGAKMKASTCTKNEAIYAFTTSLLSSLEYALPVTNLTESQWEKILSPALIPSLHKAGVSKSISRASLYGPAKFQGFNIQHPYYTQQIKHVTTLLQEVHSNTQTGMILLATAEQLRLELGFPLDINTSDFNACSAYITHSWYSSLWKFLWKSPITITENFTDPPMLRQRDTYLMSLFSNSGYKGEELRLLNEIRMALQIITISDIATADGNSIRHSVVLLQHSNSLRCNFDWPRAVPLSTNLKSLWKKALCRCLLRNPDQPSSRKLKFHLCVGPWLTNPNDLPWDWFWSPDESRFYHQTPSGWETWTPHNGPRANGRYKNSGAPLLPTKPSTATYLLSVATDRSMVKADGWGYADVAPEPPVSDDVNPFETTYPDIQSARFAFLSSPGVLLDTLSVPSDNGLAIANAITNGSASAVSDGSFDSSIMRGSSAFIISCDSECTDESQFVSGSNLTTGNPPDQSAYRSELAGALATLSATAMLVSHYKIQSGTLTIAFDGAAALKECKSNSLLVSQPCFDYIQTIHNLSADLPCEIRWKWVRGHQREQGMENIDWWGRMNDLVDSNAKQFLRQSCKGRNPAPLYFSKLFYEPWTISLLGIKQPSLNKTHCYEALFAPKIFNYWERHHDIPIPSCLDVDWGPSNKAIKRLAMGHKRWFWKFSTGCIGVGNQLFHRRHQEHSNCPLCQTPNEKVSHIFHCPDRSAIAFAKQRITHNLSDALVSLETEPVLSAAILDILFSWRQAEPILPINFDQSIRPIILQQCSIGWNNFFLGRWTPLWQHHQASYYADLGSRKSSLRWATAIIHKLLLTAWDLWQYRNGRLHAHAGPYELAQHSRLDTDITSEFNPGSANLPDISKHLIEARPLPVLLQDSLEGKRQWLLSIRAAKLAFAAHLGTTPAAFTNQATMFRAWLGISDTPTHA